MTFFMNRLTVTTQDKEPINTWNEKNKVVRCHQKSSDNMWQ